MVCFRCKLGLRNIWYTEANLASGEAQGVMLSVSVGFPVAQKGCRRPAVEAAGNQRSYGRGRAESQSHAFLRQAKWREEPEVVSRPSSATW